MRRLLWGLSCLLAFLLAAVGILVLDVGNVSADGAPVKVILTYLPNVSNWGPTDATGVAEIVGKEGTVSVRVVGLPHLSGETYLGWLINTRTNQSMPTGRFNTDNTKVAKADFVLPSEIPDTGWNMFLVTVESQGQEPQAPSQKKSIGGYYPDSAEAMKLPSLLPKTGGDTDQTAVTGRPAVPLPATTTPPANVFSGNNTLFFGVVVLGAVALGVLNRMRTRK